jgi:hypothetical protein
LPIRLARAYSDKEIEPLHSVRPVRPGKTFDYPAGKATQADVRLDLTGKHPFELFTLNNNPAARTMTAKLAGLWSARLPGVDGTVGTGAYLDLGRSRFTIRYANPADNPPLEYPGPTLTLERLGQFYSDRIFTYPVFGNYRSEVVLELHPTGADETKPLTLRLQLPDDRGGDTLDLSDHRVTEARLAAAATKVSPRPAAGKDKIDSDPR